MSSAPSLLSPSVCDRWLVLLTAALFLSGLLMVASASVAVSTQHFHQPFHYFFHQLVYFVIGVLTGAVIIQFDTSEMEQASGFLMAGILLLLALVLFPGVGRVVNGSARWLGIGPFIIQVSEITKPVVVLYMASYLVRHHEWVTMTLEGFLKPMGILAVVSVLLLREPDFGSTVVIMLTVLGMMFLAGMRLRYFLLLVMGVGLALIIPAVAAPYRMARLTAFVDPWQTAFSSGYQLTQSLIAFGRGGWFGVGLGNSIQKLFYLPEAHTDFLFAVTAEELGFAGILLMTVCFMLLVFRILLIGRRAQRMRRHFAALTAYGLGFWIAIQYIVSIGVNCGVLPTKGLTLPLVSYGGSSMLANCIAVAILLRIDYESRQARRAHHGYIS